MKTYYLDEESGEISSKRNILNRYNCAIFIYNEEENTNEIEGGCPLIYSNEDNLVENFPITDLKHWLKENKTIVIRPINIISK